LSLLLNFMSIRLLLCYEGLLTEQWVLSNVMRVNHKKSIELHEHHYLSCVS
jgi:hypothetical protein